MKKKKGLIKTSLACALIFGGVGLLAGCGNGNTEAVITDIYVGGEFSSIKEFEMGSDISLVGATVEVNFSDGSSESISVTDEMWNKSDYDFTTLGEKEITINFKVKNEDKSQTIRIKIVNPADVESVIYSINQFIDL